MLNVCFSEAVRGSLKCTRERINPVDSIICIPDDLSVGEISNIEDFETRKRSIIKFGGAFYDTPKDFTQHLDTVCRNLYREFFEQIHHHDQIMIWYSNSPYEFCGMLYVSWLLRNTPASVRAVNCSQPIRKEGSIVFHHSAGEICAKDFSDFAPYIRDITNDQKQAYAQQWEVLVSENGQLRVFDGNTINQTAPYAELIKKFEENSSLFLVSDTNTIKTADISYYDQFILDQVPGTPVKVAEVIGATLGRLSMVQNVNLGDGLIALRIKSLIQQGVLKMESYSNRFYENMIKKTNYNDTKSNPPRSTPPILFDNLLRSGLKQKS